MPRPNSKTQVVRLRVTPKEKAKIEAKANKRGETMSDYIRAKTLKE